MQNALSILERAFWSRSSGERGHQRDPARSFGIQFVPLILPSTTPKPQTRLRVRLHGGAHGLRMQPRPSLDHVGRMYARPVALRIDITSSIRWGVSIAAPR